MKPLNFLKKIALNFNEKTKSNDLKTTHYKNENFDLIVYTGSILNCKVDAIVNSVDPSLQFKSKQKS